MDDEELRARFLSKITKQDDDCWIWNAAIQRSSGYGMIRSCGVTHLSHRMSYHLFVGEIPAGLCVLHKCDVRPCVNPQHLFVGTIADNNADMIAKGRHVTQFVDGQRNPEAKINEATVLEIRRRLAAGESQTSIGRSVGLAKSTIGRIAIGRLWKSVPDYRVTVA